MVYLVTWYYILSDFLNGKKQSVLHNGQRYTWEHINVGISQGSILGLLF